MVQLLRHKVYPSVLVETPSNPEDVTWRTGDTWRHNTDNQEGFKSASCSISGDRDYLRAFFEEKLGHHWRLEDIHANRVWEGMIWSVRLTDEGWQQTRSLDTFANRLRVIYTSRIVGGRLVVPGVATWTEDTTSQAQFGIKESIQTIGEATAVRAQGLADLVLDSVGWPGRSKEKTDSGGTTLQVNLRGYMQTLAWRTYNATVSGTANASAFVGTIVAAVGQFISSTTVETNTFQFPTYHNRDRFALSILRDLVSLGDGTDPWIIGVYEDQILRYEAQNTDVNMFWNKNAPTPVRLDGTTVDPWLIRPNDVIKAPWILPGYTLAETPQRDPTVLTVKEVGFSAPYQVSITGTHDERIEVMLNRIQKTRW